MIFEFNKKNQGDPLQKLVKTASAKCQSIVEPIPEERQSCA